MSVIRKRINSVKKKKRDYGTMTYDYDNDIFELGPNIGIPVKAVIVIVNGHGQKFRSPGSNENAI